MCNFDWMEPARQLRVKVNQDQARQLGISSQALAGVLNAAVTGTTVTQVRDDIYLVNVVARAIDSERVSFASLDALQVPTASGRMVPLRQFATFVEEQEFPLVWRRDRVPTLTVRADVTRRRAARRGCRCGGAEDRRTAGQAAEALLGGHWRAVRGKRHSSASVFAVVPLMIVLMLFIMMVMLVSFRRLAMVIAILPLGLIGVVLALLAFNRPLGFVAILGILALIGMIAKNAVILIVSIEEERAAGAQRARRGAGLGHQPAAADDADGTVHRARPGPDRADRVLGADGLRHHGRADGGHLADAGPVAGDVHHGLRPWRRQVAADGLACGRNG